MVRKAGDLAPANDDDSHRAHRATQRPSSPFSKPTKGFHAPGYTKATKPLVCAECQQEIKIGDKYLTFHGLVYSQRCYRKRLKQERDQARSGTP